MSFGLDWTTSRPRGCLNGATTLLSPTPAGSMGPRLSPLMTKTVFSSGERWDESCRCNCAQSIDRNIYFCSFLAIISCFKVEYFEKVTKMNVCQQSIYVSAPVFEWLACLCICKCKTVLFTDFLSCRMGTGRIVHVTRRMASSVWSRVRLSAL